MFLNRKAQSTAINPVACRQRGRRCHLRSRGSSGLSEPSRLSKYIKGSGRHAQFHLPRGAQRIQYSTIACELSENNIFSSWLSLPLRTTRSSITTRLAPSTISLLSSQPSVVSFSDTTVVSSDRSFRLPTTDSTSISGMVRQDTKVPVLSPPISRVLSFRSSPGAPFSEPC